MLSISSFIIIHAPSTFTFFPYTSLFRSDGAPGRGRPARRGGGMRGRHRRAGDRKSTRLNSSHEWISYAVFCLKKKNRKLPGFAGAIFILMGGSESILKANQVLPRYTVLD